MALLDPLTVAIPDRRTLNLVGQGCGRVAEQDGLFLLRYSDDGVVLAEGELVHLATVHAIRLAIIQSLIENAHVEGRSRTTFISGNQESRLLRRAVL